MTKNNERPKLLWQANDYHDLSFAQKNAALPLLKRLEISLDEWVLDVGCGDGWITANIANIATAGKVLGIDLSPEMHAFATKKFSKESYPNLEFKLTDGQNFVAKNTFDVVFSSFAMQWFERKNIFVKNCYISLKTHGRLCFTIPLSISPELQQSVDFVISTPELREYFRGFAPNWFFEDTETIRSIVADNGFQIVHFASCIQEVSFPSRQILEKYILLWFPYLKPLPEHRQMECFAQIMDQYFKILPIQIDGSAILRIPRVDLIAEKN